MKISLFPAWRFGEDAEGARASELIGLLADIRATGSIAAAARARGLSYRHAWGYIERWQARLGHALVEATRGSGARLTRCGERLVELDARARRRLAGHLEAACEEMRRGLAELEAPARAQIAIVASHDLAVQELREVLEGAGHAVNLHFRGSLDSLAALCAGRCDAAGFHFPEGALGRRIWAEYRRLLSARRHALIGVCRRVQGLIVRRGNPLRLRRVTDLARPGVRFLNRQPGAGTRILLDLLLSDAKVDPGRIPGYGSEEYTHSAVAALVANGAADAGVGIEAAARRFSLGFVPLVTEHYYFAVARKTMAGQEVRALEAAVASEAFDAKIRAMAGYDAEIRGAHRSVADLDRSFGG